MKRLFIDMDGTLCRFYEKAFCVEKCREPGFFLGLNPYENLVEAVQILRKTALAIPESFHVYILSAVFDDKARDDKQKWIERFIGDGIPAFFVAVDTNKAEIIGSLFESKGLTKDDYLLDDYSKNLVEWSAAGGTAVKFRNEVNGRGWNGYNFSGHTLYHDQNPEELAHDILSIMGLIDEEKTSPEESVSEEVMQAGIDRMMNKEIVLFLHDGVLEGGFTTDPEIEVTVCDFDSDMDDEKAENAYWDECKNRGMQLFSPNIFHPEKSE